MFPPGSSSGDRAVGLAKEKNAVGWGCRSRVMSWSMNWPEVGVGGAVGGVEPAAGLEHGVGQGGQVAQGGGQVGVRGERAELGEHPAEHGQVAVLAGYGGGADGG